MFPAAQVRLNDLYVLDVKSMSWSQQGNPTAAKERRRKKQAERGAGAAAAGSSLDDKVAVSAGAAAPKLDLLDDIDG